MDNKKVVQATASVTGVPPQSQPQPQAQPQPLQQQQQQQQQHQQQQPQQQTPRVKGVPDGVSPSISGVRRRSGPNQGLRSPAAKRPVSAPVALQGWLHKQGSEGLMLWKKRWFVLSEYCLFYYKGPEEEKLLGSILLPSYRVTVCRPEDKINKKFAFKAEHANMRTYHFAADTRESMNQWVNALTLASLLQDPNPGGGEIVLAADGNVAQQQQQQPNDGDRSARPSVSSISSIMNQSADDSDSGFHGFQSRDDPSHASNNNSSPNSVNTGSFPGSSGTNTSASNNANNNNNNNNNNPVNVNNSVNASMHDTVQQSQPQPLINGWMQQQSPQYRDHGVIGQQSPGVQYNHQMIPGVIQQQPMHQQQIIYQQHPHLAQQQQMMQQQQQQQQQHKHNVSPQQQQQQQQQNPGNLPRNYGQPVYANAPPKPRRLTDNPNDYSTPSPDPDYRKSPVSPDVRLSSKSPMSAVEYIDTRNPNAIYGQRMTPQQQQSLRTDKSGLNYGFNQGVAQPAERRTPDTYGRSNTKPTGRQQQVVRTINGGDYEDVYAGPPPQLYQRPAGPVGYTKGPAPAPIPIPVYTQQPQQQQQQQMHPQYYVVSGPGLTNAAVMRQPPPQQQARTQPPPRPHSADFLEYEATRRPNQQMPTQPTVSGQQRCPQRPKSSLDIVNPSDVAVVNDNYFYSEERYAAQMRQSAVYLHQGPQHLPQQQQQQQPAPPPPQQQQQQKQQPQQQQQPRNQSLSRATTPSKSTASRDTESGIGTLSEMSCPSVRRSQREHSHQPHSLQRHTDLTSGEASHHLRRSLRESRGPSLIHSDHHSPGRSLPRDYEAAARLQPGVVGSTRSSSGGRCWSDQSQQQQFARSASARLPRSRHPAAIIDYDDDDEDDEDDYAEKSSGQDSRDGERKIQQREESMKRLLEWKQRMLQSPLTRKPTASSSSQRNHQQHNADLANCYKQQALLELAAHEASLAEQAHRHSSRRRDDAHHRPHHPRSKSTDARRSNAVAGGSLHHNALPRYNSYSSDDEASGSGSVIGRDPLPPRAVSTSQLAASTSNSSSNSNNVQRQQQQSPSSQQVSTLPLPRSSGVGAASVTTAGPSSHHRQHNNLPVHQQPGPQSTTMLNMIGHGDHEDYATHILRAASSGDVRMLNNDLRDPRIASPSSGQRLVSPTNHLRVISPVDHRVSSPSDSERHVHSQSDRGLSSPLSRDSERGSNPALRQMQRGGGSRQSGELLHKRSHSVGSSNRRSSSGRPSSGLQVSAGELLGRTHEELVLLLIQLRRQSATLCKAMETCHMEIEAQARLVELDTPRRLENLQKLEELKKHLMDLEKQYEKGKPLVNLVDNMVKLGSLYNCNKQNGVNGGGSLSGSRYDLMPETSGREHRDRLEFNQRVQEQRLLAEERRDWDRLSPDHGQLQAKVQQLYKLDQLLQEESGTLHSLQQNKELLEKALGGLRHKMQGCSRSNPAEAERYREQQLLLERELSRVRLLLAHNSKKLEETVAENARLEQDLVVLRQKLQASRRYAGNVQTRDSTGTTAALEKELRRVQQLVGDLQRQRQELSIQVRQLTEKSHSLVQQIRPQATSTPQVHQSKKRTPNSWLETDLDSGLTQEHGLDVPSSPASSSMSMSPHAKLNGSPYSHQQYNHHNHQQQQQQPLSSPQYVKELQASQSRSPASTSSSSSSQYCVRQVQGQASSPQNSSQISALSPQLREQIQQHQMKQQLLKDQMQGKSSSPVQQVAPLYVNAVVQDSRRLESMKHYEQMTNGGPILPPEYVPPPPPPPSEEAIMMNGGYGHDDGKFAGLMHNREKQEIKTVRIVKRESERRQRDRGDRTGNIGIPLTNGLQAPGGARRLGEDEFGGSQQFEAQLDRVIEESQPVPIMHAQSSIQLSELDDTQFQRSMSLPRGFGGHRQPQQQNHPAVHQAGPVPPPPRSDSMTALRNIMARRHRVRFESQDAGSSDSTLSPYTDSPTFSSSQGPASSASSNYYYCHSTSPPYSPPYQQQQQQQQQPIQHRPYPIYNNVQQQQHYGSTSSVNPMSPEPPARPVLCSSTELLSSCQSVQSLNSTTGETVLSPQLSPVFKSEAAKQIIKEMTEKKPEPTGRPRRRQVPREKRRHYTVSSSKPLFDLEDAFTKMGMGRARDDLDMERALRPRINAPDVVRSTLSHKELKYNESTIDQLLGTPNKIVIPERYVPEKTPELTAEEQEQRLKKAESIRKMLSETSVTTADGTEDEPNTEKSNSLKKKVADEKRQRDHILQLNQILAKQVMEKSKMVAVKALATLPLNGDSSIDDDDLSPVTPLPLYQQRENFYS